MFLKEETIFTTDQFAIIDADCIKGNVIVLLKGKGENIIQLNGKPVLTGPAGHSKIRFTKDHFCLLNDSTLSFYTQKGEWVSNYYIGNDIFELFPYRQGVLCVYGDEGVFGKGIEKNRLSYVSLTQGVESYYGIAAQHNLLYEALFARYKPYACLHWGTDELILLNEQLEKEKSLKVPFGIGNVISFALSYEYGVFIEEDRLWLWEFGTTGKVSEYHGSYPYNTRAIFHRHEYLFLSASHQEVRAFKPVISKYLQHVSD
ncbi:hypothetical protein [Planomicrobium sp. CPCC 101110]|uniref:hypothetical protein n=1 Tax=Planomicrobium sp. CPCC 101110 TaxID=2599619 RepID=UPI0011B6101C|nr:hypothetical protein [Planomicrobium sp. CPCC 101110]TWT26025.1 hypothetical protein FQV30_09550 [Planomicrobium sp. CPCC 101110]